MTIPNEGESLVLNVVFGRVLTDRDANMQVGLYTNAGLNLETATEAALTEPTDGDYARIALTDGGWSITSDQATRSPADFTAATTPMTGIRGAFITTISAGGTQRIIAIVPYPAAPLTLPVGETLRVDPSALAA